MQGINLSLQDFPPSRQLLRDFLGSWGAGQIPFRHRALQSRGISKVHPDFTF